MVKSRPALVTQLCMPCSAQDGGLPPGRVAFRSVGLVAKVANIRESLDRESPVNLKQEEMYITGPLESIKLGGRPPLTARSKQTLYQLAFEDSTLSWNNLHDEDLILGSSSSLDATGCAGKSR